MTEFRLLDEQRPPVEKHGEHCLLAAGAGSGKTRVLVERYLRVLEGGGWDPALPGRILAITFTEKAAQEMRQRVLDRLGEIAAAAATGEKEALHHLLREMEAAPISTIHGFCSRLLKEHAVEAGLDPRFSVPGELDLAALRVETLDELLAGEDPDLRSLGARFELKTLASALDAFRELRRSLGLPPADLEGERADRLVAEQRLRIRRLIGEELLARHAVWARALERFCDCTGGEHPLPSSRKKLEEARALLATSAVDTIDPALPGRLKDALKGLTNRGKAIDDEQERMLKSNLETLRGDLTKAVDLAAAWRASDPDEPAAAASDALARACFRLTGRYDARIREKMRARAWLDFEDLQLEAVDLLRRNEGVRRRFHALYAHVLVDEFQDTNRLQLELVRQLVPEGTPASERSLFLVGDARQSIYAFRNADVAVFRAEGERMSALGQARTLEHNHRSHPDLLAFFNAFFPRADFPPMLSPSERDGAPRVLVQVNLQEATERMEPARLRAARALVATLVAAREDGLVVGRGETRRPVDWGDMAILVRGGASVRPLGRALAEAGVPYDADAGREYFIKQELLDLEALVAALDDPYHPFTLARGLRGDLIGVDRADLLTLLPPKWERRDREGLLPDRDRGELLARLERAAAGELDLGEDGRRRVSRFLAMRRRFAGRLRRLPLRELIPELIEAAEFDLRVAADPRALKVLRNLRQLAEFLGEMESGRRLGLREFLSGMDNLREHSPRYQEAWVPEEGGSLLRILTIHGAKGLEFPLVALFDLDRALGQGHGLGEMAVLRGELNEGPTSLLGLKPKDPGDPADKGEPDIVHAWIKTEAERREAEENLRLLYVAMTRAEDHLILAGTMKRGDGDPLETFMEPSSDPGRSFFDRLRSFLAAGERTSLCRVAMAGAGDRLAGDRMERATPQAPPVFEAPDYDRLLILPEAENDAPMELPVTSLTLLGSCPLRWLLARRLGLGGLFRVDGEPWVPVERAELERGGPGGATMGSALHAILERWDFRATFDEAFAAACPAGLDPALADASRRLLGEFFAAKQPWLTRLAEAEEMRREEPFVFALGDLLLHGQTDLMFRWRGQWVLMDWKSDRVSGRERTERRVGHHRCQVVLYALAMEAAGRKPDQALLVFLRSAEEGAFRQVKLEPFDLEWAMNRAHRLAALARSLSRLEPDLRGRALIESVPVFKDPPCQDCPFRDGPCPRDYRLSAHARNLR